MLPRFTLVLLCAISPATIATESGLPLATTREVHFETREGTWMSVDVAPDGRHIAFDLLGDIYLLPAAGGRARLLVGGADYAVQPRFSPDGGRIVFVSDRSGADNLWIVDAAGGQPTIFTSAAPGEQMFFGGPDWAPDGASIVVWTTRRRNWEYGNLPREIRRYPLAERGESFEALTGSGLQAIPGAEYPSLSPDLRYLYYAGKRPEPTIFSGDRILPIWQLVRHDLRTGTSTPLTNRNGGALAPALSPDGRYIVYGSRDLGDTGLRLLDLETGNDRWLLFPIARDQQESNYFYNLPGMSFTPDSRAVVAAFAGGLWRVEIDSGRATPIPFVAEVRQALGPLLRPTFRVDDREVRAREIRNPVLSPDGRRIAFTALHRLWVVSSAGGKPVPLVARNSDQYDPAWSPDGQRIVYADWHDAEGGHLYSVSTGAARSAAPTRLTATAANYLSPTFSTDGRQVHALRLGGHPDATQAPYDHVAIPAQGGPLTVVGPVSAGVTRIGFRRAEPGRVFLSTGARLLSREMEGGTSSRTHAFVEGYGRLYSSGFGGSVERWAAGRDLNVLQASEVLASPRGNQLLAQVGPHAYLANLTSADATLATVGTLSVASPKPEQAAVVRLTRVGGQYPSWSADGRTILYSLGASIFRHDAGADGQFSAQPTREISIDIRLPEKRPRGRLAFTNARVITMNGEEVLERATIVIDGHRIAAVGAAERVAVPAGARVFDLTGKTVLPGFIDTHRHAPTGAQRGARPLQPWQNRNYLAFGVTTTHNPAQPVGELDDGDYIRIGGAVGPRIFGTGPALEWWDGPFDTYDDVREAVRRYADFWRTGRIKQYVTGDRLVRQWIAMAARERQLWVTIEGEDTNYNLTHVLDGYSDLAHTMGVAPLHDDVLQLIARSGTSVQYQFGTLRGEGAPSAMFRFMDDDDPLADPKALAFFPRERLQARLLRRLHVHAFDQGYPLMARQAHALASRGATVSLGDHGEWLGLGMHWELRAAASGMSNHEALRMATILGARALGLEADLGSVAPGKLADLVVLDADPLADIRHSKRLGLVVKNGEVFRASDLYRLWPDAGPVPFVRWWDRDEPAMRDGASRSAGEP